MKTVNENPNPGSSVSQTRRILAYMREGNEITPGEARRLVGYKPPRRMVEVTGYDADGRPVRKRVMSYHLEKES